MEGLPAPAPAAAAPRWSWPRLQGPGRRAEPKHT